MTVEHASRRIGNRVLLVIPFRQHGVKRGDRTTPGLGVAGALHQLGQLGNTDGG